MADRRLVARLRITPCGMFEPITHTISLEQIGSNHFVTAVERNGQTKKQVRQRIAISERVVQEQLDKLKQATIPAFPVSPMVCDGSYLELTIEGECSTLTLGWWTIEPEGAECLSEFADWMQEMALGTNEQDNEDE